METFFNWGFFALIICWIGKTVFQIYTIYVKKKKGLAFNQKRLLGEIFLQILLITVYTLLLLQRLHNQFPDQFP